MLTPIIIPLVFSSRVLLAIHSQRSKCHLSCEFSHRHLRRHDFSLTQLRRERETQKLRAVWRTWKVVPSGSQMRGVNGDHPCPSQNAPVAPTVLLTLRRQPQRTARLHFLCLSEGVRDINSRTAMANPKSRILPPPGSSANMQ
ncbi:uncharacterized protein EI90DRAFT_103420 [Cantharellus anzutake]|uniref:uncharacterized protein n=1 Tax=Cantharellus anzutake TaxID=1750568 RepID=UPI0019085B66|nr:uncharacterized protein EI90DRAFT_103420 [Cantharellus anzutake]KAF8337029.1 hypothetical protein EI90DRAFT_103420 [Cantharellus anzutake]